MPKDPDAAAAKIAAGQHGLITWWQARHRAGLTERQIEWRVATKRWRRLQRGVYAIAGVTSTWVQSLLAAQLTSRTERVATAGKKVRIEALDDAVVCGESALWLRDCTRLGKPKQHELLVNRQRPPRVKGALTRKTATLPAEDLDVVNGVLTLAVPRLLADLSGRLDRNTFTAVVDDLLGAGEPDLREEVHRRVLALRRGRKGVDLLVELTKPGAEAAFRSWLERLAAAVFLAAGLPPAQWNLELRDDQGALIGIGDAVWPDHTVDVELDGLRFHSTDAQRRRDRAKDRRLTSITWMVLRYTWLDIVETPDMVTAEIAAALRKRAPSPTAPGAPTHT